MALSRRDALIAGGLAVGGATVALSGCGRVAAEVRKHRNAEPWQEPKPTSETRLVERMTFGWSVAESKQLQVLGRETYVKRQLKADLEEPLELTFQIQSLDCIRMQPVELMEIPRGRVTQQLQSAAILRAVYSPNQLRERMVDFWSNHFNIYAGKVDGAFFKGNEEESIIRRNALGNFGEMARAMAKSPAMLVYLDNNQNYKGHPNENYARELLELHTLGIDGGYSQKDIQEVARCLTGWMMEDRYLGGLLQGERRPKAKGSFRFDPNRHDDGEKFVLGKKIPAGGGVKDGERVLDILLTHSATAKYLARKLVVFFTGDRSVELEAKVAKQYDATNGDIGSMLTPILASKELLEGPPILRRPFEFMCAALRRSGAATDGGPELQQYLRTMGQPLYEWPLPDGYPVDQISWGTNLLPRWQFAHDLSHGTIKNTSVPKETEVATKLASHLANPQFQYM